MAAKDDNTMMWVLGGVALFLFLRSRQAPAAPTVPGSSVASMVGSPANLLPVNTIDTIGVMTTDSSGSIGGHAIPGRPIFLGPPIPDGSVKEDPGVINIKTGRSPDFGFGPREPVDPSYL